MTKKCKCPVGECAGHMEVSAKVWRGLDKMMLHRRGLASTRIRVVRRGKVMVWLDSPFTRKPVRKRRKNFYKPNQE